MIVFWVGTVLIEFLGSTFDRITYIQSQKTLDQKKQVHIRKFHSLAPKPKNRPNMLLKRSSICLLTPFPNQRTPLKVLILPPLLRKFQLRKLLVLSKLPSEICQEKTQTLFASRQPKSCTQHAPQNPICLKKKGPPLTSLKTNTDLVILSADKDHIHSGQNTIRRQNTLLVTRRFLFYSSSRPNFPH